MREGPSIAVTQGVARPRRPYGKPGAYRPQSIALLGIRHANCPFGYAARMAMSKPITLGILSLLTMQCLAQTPLGLVRNTSFGMAGRGGGAASFNPAVLFTRIDVEKYSGWGFDPISPTSRTFTGLRFLIQDQNLATVDPFTMVVYTEDPAAVSIPLVTSPVATTSAFSLPSGSGQGAFTVTMNFASPIQAPAAADVFVGIGHSVGWNASLTDGTSMWVISSTGPLSDRPGPSAPLTAPGNTPSGAYVPSMSLVSHASQIQFLLEPIVDTGGVASALHFGDAAHPDANVWPGTSCMFSSQYPDGTATPRNAGRADNLGITFVRPSLADGSLVCWVADLTANFAPQMAMNAVLPGSTGALALNPNAMIVIGFSSTTAGVAANVMAFPTASRALLTGVSIAQQSLALEIAANVVHAGPAQISVF